MIIYIHGYGGSGEGVKAQLFREYCTSRNIPFIAPSLSYVPDLAIKTLEELIESYGRNVQLIGSSMGGYFSIYLANKYKLKAVLLNPSIFPYITLKQTLGLAPNFYDESKFEWNENHLDMLRKYDIKDSMQFNFMLMVQKGDTVLDFQEAVDKFCKATLVVEEGGSHSFDDIQTHFPKIEKFLLKF